MAEPPDRQLLRETARDYIVAVARDPDAAARIEAELARRRRPTLVDQILEHFRTDPEARALVERAKAQRDAELAARKASRRLPTPPKRQIPSAGRRSKR